MIYQTKKELFSIAWLQAYVQKHSLTVKRDPGSSMTPEGLLQLTARLLSRLTRREKRSKALSRRKIKILDARDADRRKRLADLVSENLVGADGEKIVSEFETDYAAKAQADSKARSEAVKARLAIRGNNIPQNVLRNRWIFVDGWIQSYSREHGLTITMPSDALIREYSPTVTEAELSKIAYGNLFGALYQYLNGTLNPGAGMDRMFAALFTPERLRLAAVGAAFSVACHTDEIAEKLVADFDAEWKSQMRIERAG